MNKGHTEDQLEPAFLEFKRQLADEVCKRSPAAKKARKRLNYEVRKCANIVLPALVARVPPSQSIDARQTAADALAIACTMVGVFIKDKLMD